MKRISLTLLNVCFSSLLLTSLSLYGADPGLTLKGTVWDVKWSPDSTRLALILREGEQDFILMVNPRNGRIVKKIPLSFTATRFDWEDARHLLLARDNPDYTSDVLRFDIPTLQSVVLSNLRPLYAHVNGIALSPGGQWWALTSSAEGLVDTALYTNQIMVRHTEVYGGVQLLFWRQGLLYVQSFVDLSYGLSEAERLARFIQDGLGDQAEYYNSEFYMGNEARVFTIDPVRWIAYAARSEVLEGQYDSPNGKYRVEIILPVEGTEVCRVIFHRLDQVR